MNKLIVFCLFLAFVSALPLESLRYRRQAYYRPVAWGYNTRRNALWQNGGYRGPNGEGSTWEGAHPHRIHNNDISLFGK